MTDNGPRIPSDSDSFLAALDDIKSLLETRKNFVGTDLPVTKLDTVISTQLVILAGTNFNFAINGVFALRTLSDIHSEMMTQYYDTTNVQHLIGSILRQMHGQEGIVQTIPPRYNWSVPVAMFETKDTCWTQNAPDVYLALGFGFSGSQQFKLYSHKPNFGATTVYSFRTNDILSVQWCEGTNSILIVCQEEENDNSTIFIETTHKHAAWKLLDKLVMEGLQPQIQSVSSNTMNDMCINRW